MKKLIFLLFLVFINIKVFSWDIVGPQNIEAINICFGGEFFSPIMICTTDGMYLFSELSYEWEYYSLDGLPIQEGVFTNDETIITVLGNGTDSDGIYSFNIENEQFSLIAYCQYPKFIQFDDYAELYYVGYENGLMVSENGINWENIDYFSGISCLEMAFSYTNLVVTADITPPNVFWSDNSGETWNTSASYTSISRISFYGGDLFGIFPDNSYSSGLYKSTNLGNSWEIEFWSTYMSDVCYDDYDDVFYVCWDNPDPGYEGIAVYVPGTSTSGLTFFNEGLPNTNINRIGYRPAIDAYFAFVCTNTGVYSFIFVDVEKKHFEWKVIIYPNPVSEQAVVKVILPELTNEETTISILNNQGHKVDEFDVVGNNSNEMIISWSKGDLPTGLYYLVIETGKEQISEKFIIL